MGPGLLICYAASYDEEHRLKGLLKTYAPIELAGYVLGLAATYAALALDIGGQQGQPALLYLVPATLVPMLVAAHLRGDLKDMMHANLPFLEAHVTLTASPRRREISWYIWQRPKRGRSTLFSNQRGLPAFFSTTFSNRKVLCTH